MMWKRIADREEGALRSMDLANVLRFTMAAAMAAASSLAAAQSLDFDAYRTRVEPIFSKKREGHARCVVCHSESNNAFKLQAWGPHTQAFTEEQSRLNFQMISRLVTPGDPERSILLLHPLSKEAGGHEFHSGGRQFPSKSDPDWEAIAAWVRGTK
jgi:hypothetical protein